MPINAEAESSSHHSRNDSNMEKSPSGSGCGNNSTVQAVPLPSSITSDSECLRILMNELADMRLENQLSTAKLEKRIDETALLNNKHLVSVKDEI